MVLLAATSPTLHYTVKKEKNRERKGLARDRIKKFRYSVRPFHGRHLYGDRSVKLIFFFRRNDQNFSRTMYVLVRCSLLFKVCQLCLLE